MENDLKVVDEKKEKLPHRLEERRKKISELYEKKKEINKKIRERIINKRNLFAGMKGKKTSSFFLNFLKKEDE